MSDYESLTDVVRENADARIGDGFVVAGNMMYTQKDGAVVSHKISGYTGRLTSRGIVGYKTAYASSKKHEEKQIEL